MDKTNLLKDKMQTVRITFSNGTVGNFIGRACVPDDDRDKVTIESIAISETEDVTDEIRNKITEMGKDDEN